jgi:hypothetical protein
LNWNHTDNPAVGGDQFQQGVVRFPRTCQFSFADLDSLIHLCEQGTAEIEAAENSEAK